MAPISRRRALQACGTALVAGVAGCSGLSGSGDAGGTPQLGRLSVSNYHTEPHTVHVLVLDGDEPVYWQSRDVAAGENDEPAGAAFTGFPTDGAAYDLLARVDDRSIPDAGRLAVDEYSADCLGLALHVGAHDDPESSALTIWTTTNPNECEAAGGEAAAFGRPD